MPEVGTGIPDKYSSRMNDASTAASKEHVRGQALTVAKLCERELCETLRATFLGERGSPRNSLATGVSRNGSGNGYDTGYRRQSSYMAKLVGYVEVLDYVGENDFHGFVASKGDELGLFMFFTEASLHKNLRPGIVAMLELAGSKYMSCTQVVACVDRKMSETDLQALTRDLGWIGFEMTTLAPWSGGIHLTSEEWLLLTVET